MKYKDIKILEINPIVYLGEEFKDNTFIENQNIFKDKIKDLQFTQDFSFECPIEDMISIHIDYEDKFEPMIKENTVDKIFGIVNELMKVIDDVKINIYLDGYIENEGNSIDLNIKEFVDYLTEEISKFESQNN